MDITTTFTPRTRVAWRTWLEDHHASAREIWLLLPRGGAGPSYLDAVEEALCFGWIDGIAKRFDGAHTAQRFTPRRPKSHWTELNKIRAQRLIDAGQMTPAGLAVLPDLSPTAFTIAPDILAALQAEPEVWAHFQAFPESYKRIRIGFIDEVRNQPEVFATRLTHFLNKTRQNKQFGITR
jgi:uncharacterized protein YdeI (YjbR/CyaY-like superfamily)